MNKIYIVVISLLLLGCDWGLGPSYKSTTETVYIDYYKVACDSRSTTMCFRLRFDTDDEFSLSKIAHSGFDAFEWGKRYTAKIKVDYDSDGDDELYRLKSIEAEEVVDSDDAPFVLALSMSSQILLDNANDSWMLAGEDAFSCIEADCILLTNAYNSGAKVQLKFSASDDKLTLRKVVCTAAENNFAATCEGINQTRWDIAHYQTDCGLFEPRLCLLYRDADGSDDSWTILHSQVTGFSADWGYEYDIQVETKKVSGSIRSAKLLKENNRDDVADKDFNVVMRTGPKGLKKSLSGKILYDGIEFDCATNGLCNLIDNAVDDAEINSERILALLINAEISGENTDLIIQSITCDESRSDFKTECVDSNDDVIWIE